MRRCPDCKTENPVESPFCSSCGLRFEQRLLNPVDTIPEGHPAVPGPAEARASLDALETTHELQPVPTDDPPAATPPNRTPLLFAGVLFIGIVVGLGLLVFVDREQPVVDLSVNRARLVGGDVQMGLPDDARTLILLGCERIESDPSVCTTDLLFANEPIDLTESVKPYEIDTFEITNAEFDRCVEQGVCSRAANCKIVTHEGKQFGAKVPKALGEPQLPVVCVDQAAAEAFCNNRGGRLPSPAEFLFAARGATKRTFPWGDHWDPVAANWAERDSLQTPVLGSIDGYAYTAPRRSHPEGCTVDGVCALSGNVSEWLNDGTVRGGSWTDAPFDLRVTRVVQVAGPRTDIGFRCAYPPRSTAQ